MNLLILLLVFVNASYAAQQYEEGWRWRESFEDLSDLVDGESIHEELTEYEHALSLQLVEEVDKNQYILTIKLLLIGLLIMQIIC